MSDPDPVDVHVGKAIRAARVKKGLTQTQLANVTGTTFQQLQKYERADNRVSASRLFAICSVLDVEIAAMFPPLADSKLAVIEGGRGPKPDFEQMMDALSPEDRKVVMAVAEVLVLKTKQIAAAA